MKRLTRRKLSVDAETLVTLSSESLAHVVGGVASRSVAKVDTQQFSWCGCGPTR